MHFQIHSDINDANTDTSVTPFSSSLAHAVLLEGQNWKVKIVACVDAAIAR
jgi:hypothetical protein